MSSVAAIPFVGWAMAPGVGAETFATAMAFLPMASAAGGWDNVPFDGAITELHKNEMVLPASIASPLRNMVTAPAANANAPAGRAPAPIVNNIAISSPDAANVANLFKRNGSSLVTALNRQISLGAAIAGRN